MGTILEELAVCIERGKVNRASSYPPDMKDKEGADEFTQKALDEGASAEDILNQALIAGMTKIGVKFKANKVFVPDVLMSAKAMQTAMKHLKPFFQSGAVQRKGKFVIGTVTGDLHDIGKNLVSMMIEGGGWEVIDLGIDVPVHKFIEAIEKNPGCIVGMSALLTTTMANMEKTVKACKEKFPDLKIIVGGAPVTAEFANKIGADSYAEDPQSALDYLGTLT